jgi:hypothetical protein
MELHIESSGLVGDRLFINDKHGVTVAEVRMLVRDAAPFIVASLIEDALDYLRELVED